MNARSPSKRILIVDDDAGVRETLDRALSRMYEVRCLPSGEGLEQMLSDFDPGLIIMDVRLPKEDGLQLCSRLRENYRYRRIPLMFLSGLIDQASVWDGFASGGDYYLTKPFDVPILMSAVERLLRRYHGCPEIITAQP